MRAGKDEVSMNKFVGNGYANSRTRAGAMLLGACVMNLCFGDMASSCTGNACDTNNHSDCLGHACGSKWEKR